jgi:3-dehydroquinate synthase
LFSASLPDTFVADQQTLKVDLGDRSYPIVIGRGLLHDGFNIVPYLAGGDCLIVSNETVAPLYAADVAALVTDRETQLLQLPDGESCKTMATVQLVIDELVRIGANRDATVIALGGGVVGDIAGFAAACYMRGIACIQVPTTLLAQVDSSVGGKTGVNHAGGKNLIGAFHQPKLVLIDTATLDTLPDRELSAGLAEVIKHGAIADAEFFSWLEQRMDGLLARDAAALAVAITASCEIKSHIVAADEREAGTRALLNFGHTFGHAIENSIGYGELLHGEAVAVGMLMAAELSGIGKTGQERLKRLIMAAGLPTRPPPTGSDALRQAMNLDKKASAQALKFVLLRSLGEAFVSTDYSEARLAEILRAADRDS